MADELIYVSLIVPIYNQEKNLPIFLKKIIKQKGDFLWEIILIDDGSTDASLQICKDFCEKHTYASVYSQSNKGVSAARNIGIKKARGKYLFFIDPDDDLTDRAVPYKNNI